MANTPSRTIDYYFTVNSPWAYLGSRELERIARDHRAEVRVKPVSVVEIFPKTGGLPLAKRSKERQAYRFVELKRWRERNDMPLVLEPPYFPSPEAPASHAILAAAAIGGDPLRMAHGVMRALWVEERDIGAHEVLQSIAEETGHDGPRVMAKAAEPEIHGAFEALTQEALDAGVFGSPFYIFNGEPFWGQDRLDMLEHALRRA